MPKFFWIALVLLTLFHAGLLARDVVIGPTQSEGMLWADGVSPVGGDYINLMAAGALTAAGRVGEVYDPTAFMSFERSIIPADIGLRIWAYPPTSLPLAVPFGFMPFHAGLAIWSLLGLSLLGVGARRIGLSWPATLLLVLSPASLSSVYFGQTGNAATGLLLIALAASRRFDGGSALAAAVLTVKPQLGLLLPVLWAVQRRFALIALTAVLVVAFVGAVLLAFGAQPWVDYVAKTIPLLDELERHGEGPFVAMIPSVFMAVRILTADAQLAQWVHVGSAVLVFAWVGWRLLRSDDRVQQSAILLMGAALVTPYIHIYDLAGVYAAALLHMMRLPAEDRTAQGIGALAVLAAWAIPLVTLSGNLAGVPAGTVLMIAVLVAVSWPTRQMRAVAR